MDSVQKCEIRERVKTMKDKYVAFLGPQKKQVTLLRLPVPSNLS